MRQLSAAELLRMRDAAEASMFDLCTISRYTPGAVDGFNVKADAWADDVDVISCGFKLVKNREAMDEAEVIMVDAELRLPYDTVLDRRDKIRLEYRLGEFIADENQETFRIIGDPIHGHAAVVVQLVRDPGPPQ